MANSGNDIKLGAWGGSRGEPWDFVIKGGVITKIIIGFRTILDSITLFGQTEDGKVNNFEKYGGPEGRPKEIILDWPREYVTCISGTYGDYAGENVIKHIKIITNLEKDYEYGVVKNTDTPFSLSIDNGGAVVGFHGLKSKYINAIGVYIRPTTNVATPP